MKLTINTDDKTVEIHGTVELNKLYELGKQFNNWKDWKIKETSSNIIFTPIYPYAGPYDTNPRWEVTCNSDTGCNISLEGDNLTTDTDVDVNSLVGMWDEMLFPEAHKCNCKNSNS